MRWIWIDRFVEFESGRRARAVKNLTLAEEHLHDHFPGWPVMPNSLIIEGLAQTGGILVGETHGFKRNVVLAKVSRARFHFPAVPGDTLIYTAHAEYIQEDGAMVKAQSHVGDRLQGEAEILFAHMDGPPGTDSVFEPENFVFTMGLLGVFKVGRTSAGGLIQPPAPGAA
jgi:3-hydroxyacyl-[acyl-carrier-protein] dehydratase